MLNRFCVNIFCYENKAVFLVYLSNQSDCIDLLLISNNFTSHYVYIKDFNRFMFNKTKHKGKKYFCKSCLQCFSGNKVLVEHKRDCLVINSKQNVKLESGFISFKNYSTQIAARFKIYADFECILKRCYVGADNKCFSNTKKYQDHVPCSLAYKVVCVDNKYSKKSVLYRGKNAVNKFIKIIFNEYNYCRKAIKKHFNRNLVMTAEQNEEFEKSNICWICDGLIENYDKKFRDHCNITGKYRGAAHYSCSTNLKVSKNVPVIFHNLKDYDNHLIFKELSKFSGLKMGVTPDGLEKYMFGKNNNIFKRRVSIILWSFSS